VKVRHGIVQRRNNVRCLERRAPFNGRHGKVQHVTVQQHKPGFRRSRRCALRRALLTLGQAAVKARRRLTLGPCRDVPRHDLCDWLRFRLRGGGRQLHGMWRLRVRRALQQLYLVAAQLRLGILQCLQVNVHTLRAVLRT